MREGAGEGLGLTGRRMRISSWMRPSLTVMSREVLGGRGGSNDVGEGI